MKLLVVVCLVVAALVSAVPPRRSNYKFSNQFQRQEDSYQPPAKEPVPHTVYGPPPQEYGPPSTPKPEYGPPSEDTTQAEGTTEAMTTTTEPESEPVDTGNSTSSQLTTQKGAYYIYHPSGLLQKVLYATKDDLTNMAYTTQVKYKNVEPIKEPIFTYDPKTLILTKLQR